MSSLFFIWTATRLIVPCRHVLLAKRGLALLASPAKQCQLMLLILITFSDCLITSIIIPSLAHSLNWISEGDCMARSLIHFGAMQCLSLQSGSGTHFDCQQMAHILFYSLSTPICPQRWYWFGNYFHLPHCAMHHRWECFPVCPTTLSPPLTGKHVSVALISGPCSELVHTVDPVQLGALTLHWLVCRMWHIRQWHLLHQSVRWWWWGWPCGDLICSIDGITTNKTFAAIGLVWNNWRWRLAGGNSHKGTDTACVRIRQTDDQQSMISDKWQ